jgi:hypothetical protein
MSEQAFKETFRATDVSAAVDNAVDKGGRPFDAFKEMPRVEPAEKSDSFRSDSEGLKSAAQELVKKRQELEQNAPTIERYYQNSAKPGERRPITETTSLRDAAVDLSDLRGAEDSAANALRNMNLRERLDAFRQQADTDDREAAKAAQPVPEPQPEAAPTPEPTQQQTNGVHPEVVEALKNPHVRAALEQEAMAHAGAREQYLQSVQMMGNAAWANVMASFPEMQTGNPQQVLEQMRTTNPQRFAEIAGHLQKGPADRPTLAATPSAATPASGPTVRVSRPTKRPTISGLCKLTAAKRSEGSSGSGA